MIMCLNLVCGRCLAHLQSGQNGSHPGRTDVKCTVYHGSKKVDFVSNEPAL